jgi:hypothetical protein
MCSFTAGTRQPIYLYRRQAPYNFTVLKKPIGSAPQAAQSKPLVKPLRLTTYTATPAVQGVIGVQTKQTQNL